MPRRDIFHDNVKQALIKDGWTITHDPLEVRFGRLRGYIDLGAEQPLGAEKAGRKIAVEIKGFVGASLLNDLEEALGQFVLYRSLLAQVEPERVVYLAVGEEIFDQIFTDPGGQIVLKEVQLRLIVVRFAAEEIVQWIE